MVSAAELPVPPRPARLPLALFDLDGTLTDPADGIVTCHRWALEALGFEFPPDVDVSSIIGPPAEEAHAILGVPPERIAESTRLYRERFAVAGWLDDTAYAGIAELLTDLAAGGWQLGVATMKLEPFAVKVLERVGLADRFAVIAGSDAARNRATKRTVIDHALGQLDRDAAGAVMIGDRRHDIDAGRSLGMTTIGVAWGFGPIEELMAADAHAIAAAPSDVADLLL